MSGDNLITFRFNNWEEIFPNSDEAISQYLGLIADLRTEYTRNQTLLRERVEANPQTGVEATIFERTFGGSARIERLDNGNVRYEFAYLGQVHTQEVVPQAGNKDHDWTSDQIVGLQAQVAAALAESSDTREGVVLATLLGYIEGKPATIGWEETMSKNKKLPQRVGYKIYPDGMLRLAKDKVGG